MIDAQLTTEILVYSHLQNQNLQLKCQDFQSEQQQERKLRKLLSFMLECIQMHQTQKI